VSVRFISPENRSLHLLRCGPANVGSNIGKNDSKPEKNTRKEGGATTTNALTPDERGKDCVPTSWHELSNGKLGPTAKKASKKGLNPLVHKRLTRREGGNWGEKFKPRKVTQEKRFLDITSRT